MALRKSDDPAASRRTESLPPARVRDAKISKSARPTSRSRPKRPPGRPFKSPSRSNSSQSRSGRSERPSVSPSVAPVPSPTPCRRVLSMLEALPVEIIEQIFLYSLNLNLPRASPVLATALSREHLYQLSIILAFWDDPITNNQNPKSEAIERVFAPLEYVRLQLEERRKLQRQVFRCKWCTRERIQEQVPRIMNLTIHRQWINAGMIMEPDQKAALDRFMARKDDTVRVFYAKGPPRIMAGGRTSHSDVERLAMIPGSHEYKLVVKPNEQVEIYSETMRGVMAYPALHLLDFPPHLVRGRSTGFTEEDVLFLEMLRMCSHNYKPDELDRQLPTTLTVVDRDATNEGIQNAIRTQNLDALTTLLKIDEFIYRYYTVTLDHPDRPFYRLPWIHFISVTEHFRENPSRSVAFLEALVRASAESIPVHTHHVAEWAFDMTRYIAKHNLRYPQINTRFVRWLSDFALRLPSQVEHATLLPSGQLFCCGELDMMGCEGRRFADEVLKPERETLGNYMPESPYKPADHWLKKCGPELAP